MRGGSKLETARIYRGVCVFRPINFSAAWPCCISRRKSLVVVDVMAHFFPAPGAPKSDYQIDWRLAPDSISTLRVTKGEKKQIGLWGARGLWVKPTMAGVLVEPVFAGIMQSEIQILTLEGRNTGRTVLQTGQGAANSVSL